MWDGFNKRKFPRVNIDCEVEVRLSGKKQVFSTMTENLGLGGTCVILDKELKRFEDCVVVLHFKKDKQELSCNGRVVWVVPTKQLKVKKLQFDTGIEFMDLDDEKVECLKGFLEVLQANTNS